MIFKQKLTKKISAILILGVLFFIIFSPVVSLAQSQTGSAPGGPSQTGSAPGGPSQTGSAPQVSTKIKNPIKFSTLNGFIKGILEGVIKIGIPLIALAIIYSGFLYVTAMGNSEKLKDAHKALLYTVVGAALILGAWTLAQLITDTVLAL